VRAARDAADARAAADAAAAARASAAEALTRAERARPGLRSAVAELCAAAAAAARQCRAVAEAHERTAAGLQAGIPRELALAPEHWLSSAARAPLRLTTGGPAGAPGVLAAALGAPGDAAAIPPPLAAAAAAADREGAALLARRDKAAHAAVAALQVAPARAGAGARPAPEPLALRRGALLLARRPAAHSEAHACQGARDADRVGQG
jgi:hypothetical protein